VLSFACLTLILVVQFALWGLFPSSQISIVEGDTHEVELYTYNPPGRGDDGSDLDPRVWRSWDDFPNDSNLMILEDSKLQSTGEIVPIGEAHEPGLLHRGLWLALLREGNEEGRYEIYLLQRAPFLKTCPGAWGLVGEHSDQGEAWIDTARRAMREELNFKEDKHRKFVNLLSNQSVLVRTHYQELGRRDLQATGIFAVVISRKEARKIRLDDEVADTKWVPIGELQGMYMCNQEITFLAKLVVQLLKQNGFE
jgi:isopentenyldiphosphate isomerase